MPGASFFSLLDDLSALLDDVATLTKIAAKKTAGVLGDDLALNAEQVSGMAASRELPVVWAVAKGSLVNKVILVPAALLLSALAPWAVTPLLMLGGLYLCFEGVEKLAHPLLHGHEEQERRKDLVAGIADPEVDLVALEKEKVKGAVRTDFVLSAEIVVITLGSVAAAPFVTRVAVLCGIALLMTVGVYGLVAGIVKLDDLGLYLTKKTGALRLLGRGIVAAAPYLMKGLSIAGTAAMFLVGGGILLHGIPGAEGLVHHLAEAAGSPLGPFVGPLSGALLGVVAGALALALFIAGRAVVNKVRS